MSRFIITIAACAAISACASATAGNSASAPKDRVIATTDVGTVRDLDHGSEVISQLRVSPAAAMVAAAAAYHELGVEIKLSDPKAGMIGNRRFSLYHRFAGAPLSSYLGCGTTTTGYGADSYRITMSLVTTIVPEATGSSVHTVLDANAEDPSSSKGLMSCLTTGALEQRVNALIAAKAGL